MAALQAWARRGIGLTLAASLAATSAAAAEFRGKVIGVADGDTITVLRHDHQQTRVRLTEVDAPEGGQAWGQRSKQALTRMVLGKQVRVVEEGEDRYGRTLGGVYAGSADVSAEMVKAGAAWAYLRYLTDRRIIALEAQARLGRRGLWSMPANQIIPPWDYRAGVRIGAVVFDPAPRPTMRRSANPARQSFAAGAGPPSNCGAKHYCSEMSSCAEARHYLHQCGLTRLDGDGDGVPCEKIC